MCEVIKMKRLLSFVFAIVISVSIFILPASATVKASDYISYATASIDMKSGCYLEITYYVAGTHVMDVIGATRIQIYENGGNGWKPVETYISYDYPEMLCKNDHIYSYTLPQRYQGIAGRSYYAAVTVYARDASGSDSDIINSNVVTAK